MGDVEFFIGLHSFLSGNEFKDVDAFDFRDHLNANTNVDVTDFFNDWVFNPGFPAFIIDSFDVSPNGSNFDVAIFVHQKLKGTNQYFSNVPMELTFMDNNWNKASTTVNLNGEFTQLNIQSTFAPTLAYFNDSIKISQAVTGENQVIKTNGIKDLNFPLFRFTTTNPGADSSLVRIEHYWVAPDSFKEPVNEWSYYISEERFWKVDGIFSNGFAANGRVFFNAKTSVGANLDNLLCGEPGFHEDSLKLLFRENASEEWMEVPDFTIANLGSATDGYGYINFDVLLKGEYALGWRKSPVKLNEHLTNELSLILYPNPVKDWITLSSSISFGKDKMIKVYDASGRVVLNKPFWASQLDVSSLSEGSYIIVIEDGETKLVTKPFVVIK
jgi:hypothetical protein